MGQVAVITGASSGIGRAIALELAARGAEVCLTGRRLEALDAVARQAGASASAVRAYPADLTLDRDLDALSSQLRRDVQRLDLLVHCAGAIAWGPIETTSIADFDRQYRTNVRAPYVLTQALLTLLKASHGQIVFINSSVIQTCHANAGPYAASKHALKAIADSLRAEVNADGVRVLSVYPGRTAGPLQKLQHKREGRAYEPDRLLQPEDVAVAVIDAVGLPRTAEVTDLHIRPFLKPIPASDARAASVAV